MPTRRIPGSTPALLAAALLASCLFAGALAPAASAAPRFREARDDLFYMYMPIAWRDSDGDAYRFGDFGGMTAAIPYLKSLGVTAVWMTPIFPSAAYHGYQHGAADQIAPRFGSEPQFWSFVQAAHAESIKVFLDFVAYGISQNTTWFSNSYGHPASIYDDWLAYTNAGNTSYLGCCPYTTWDGSTVGFIHWDLRNPVVTGMVTDWALHWLDPNNDGDPADGVDGFRLDHVSAWHPEESPWGYDLAWWQAWRAALAARAPGVFVFAEQADWGSYGADLLPAFDAAFTKPFEFAARAALQSGHAAGLASSMAATLSTLPAGRLYLATLGNHDVSRLSTALGDDPGRVRAAAAVHLLQPLPPVIYFGDELGMRGAKNMAYVGDAVDLPFREPFKWNAAAGPPMSHYLALNAAAYAGRVARDHDGRSVEEQSGAPGSLLERYRALAALRHAHPALRRGTYHAVTASDPAVWAFVKHDPGTETLLVAIHLGGAAASPALDLSAFEVTDGASVVTDVETGAAAGTLTAANRAAFAFAVGAAGYRIARLGVTPGADGVDLPAQFAAAPLVLTQDTPTAMGDNVNELDQLFARPEADGLALAITGNLAETGNGVALLFDTRAGGQQTLDTAGFPQPPSAPPALSGLTLEPGFEADALLWINAYAGVLYVDRYRLDTGGGGAKRYLGSVAVGVEAPLSGGNNANGFEAAYFPGNAAGVTATSAAGAATAKRGLRLLVPWADLFMTGPGAPVELLAVLVRSDGWIGNQTLPGLGGLGPLGFAPLDLGEVPGTQSASLGTTLDAPPSAPAAPRLALGAIAPNPARGPLRVAFELAGGAPASLALYDVAGRRVLHRDVTALGAGRHALELGGTALAPGLYFVRLAEGAASRAARVAIAR